MTVLVKVSAGERWEIGQMAEGFHYLVRILGWVILVVYILTSRLLF